VALCPGPEVSLEDLPEAVKAAGLSLSVQAVEGSTTLAQSKQEVEVRSILEALSRHSNNRLRAAAELGISRVALYKKLHKYGLIDKPAPLPAPHRNHAEEPSLTRE
jgi:DNA-binding NtrC family response regulator